MRERPWIRRLRLPAMVVAVALGVAGFALPLAGCGSDDAPPEASGAGQGHDRHGDLSDQSDHAGLTAVVYRSPTCSCCREYEAYLRREGFEVESEVVDDLAAVKAQHDVPTDAEACHTVVLGDYVVEGHVPVAAIDTLLQEQPAIDGIALPGMPAGSPGMSGQLEGPLEILSLEDGTTAPYLSV